MTQQEFLQDLEAFLQEWHNDEPTVWVHTSGSTGTPKPMQVEKERMMASARLTCSFLGLKEGDSALLCMPLQYIAGKMVGVRSLGAGLKLVPIAPCGHPLKDLKEAPTFAAMIPMQVYNTLQEPEEREKLMGIKHLIIGGGAIDDALGKALKDFPNHVWSTYGMTETLSHIALRRINGAQPETNFSPLEGVTLTQDAEGCLIVFDPQTNDAPLHTNDLVELLSDGRFRILGRRDNVVCSGGIKLQIEEIEHKLATVIPVPFMLTYVKDERLGQALTMLYTGDAFPSELHQLCVARVGRYEVPKHFFRVSSLPMTETGKPARSEAHRVAEELLKLSDNK